MPNPFLPSSRTTKPYSLKQRLLLISIIFSILLCLLLGFSAYHIALEETQEILDKQMQEMAYFLADTDIQHMDSGFKPRHRYDETDIFIDIWTYQPSSLHAEEDAEHLRLPQAAAPHFQMHNASVGRVKAYVLPLANRQIQISQLISVRRHLARELALSMLVPYFLLMPLALFGLTWLINKNLQPLLRLQRSIASRHHADLTPIDADDLPQEIVPTVQEMNLLFRRIEHAQQQQRQFVADAAHELRSPITALNLQLKVLQKTAPYPIEQEKHFIHLKNGLNRIQHLVTQMMELAHHDVQDACAALHPVDLSTHLTFAIEQLMYSALKHQIDLGVKQLQPVQVLATVPHLNSIIFNILDNAIKYTPDQGKVDVSIGMQQGWGWLKIEDSGAGVPEADYPKLVERFVRIPNSQQQVVGSGLGLSIVQSAIQQLNGQLLFAQSATLGGLAVTVMLPLAEAASNN